MKPIKIFLIIFFLVFGATMAFGFLLADEWEQPTQGAPNGGLVRPVVDEGSLGVYYTSRVVEVNDNFVSGIDNFYVDTDTGRVGVGTNAPVATLEVSGGGLQLVSSTILPTCNSTIIGSIIFYSSMPRVCTNSGWQILHADTNNDGRY